MPAISISIASVLVLSVAALLGLRKAKSARSFHPWGWISGGLLAAALARLAGILLPSASEGLLGTILGDGLSALAAGGVLIAVLWQGKPPTPSFIPTAPREGEGEGVWEKKAAILQSALNSMSEGISVVDGDLRLIAHNRRFLEMLEFPMEWFGNVEPFEKFIRFNAERGEYGPGDIEEQVRERVDLARRFEAHQFERVRPDGTVLEIKGNPLPEGGFVTTYSDITRQKQAETELLRQQELLKALFDTLPHILYVKDLEGRYLMVNQALADFHETSSEEMLGQKLEGLQGLSEEYVRTLREMDQQVIAENRLVKSPEIAIVKPNGETQWRLVTKLPLHDEKGNVSAIVGLVEDTTARKMAEEELKSSRELLRTVFDTIPHRVFIKDRDLRFLMVNKAMADAYEVPAEAFQGSTVFDFPFFSEDLRNLVTAQDRKVLETGKPMEIPGHVSVDKSGNEMHSNFIRLPWFDQEGNLAGIVGMREDITEKVIAQKELRKSRLMMDLLFDSVPNPIWVKDLEGRYMMVNKALADLRDSTPQEMLGRQLSESRGVLPEELEEMEAMDREVLETQQRVYRQDIKATKPDGAVTRRHMAKAPLIDAEGALIGIAGISTDITELKQAEEDLRSSRELLRTVFDTLPHWIFVKDMEGRYMMANRAFAEPLGLHPGELVGGTAKKFSIGTEEEQRQYLEADRQVLDTKAAVDDPEVSVTLPNGRQYYLHVIRVPLRDAEGNIFGILVVTEDITTRRETEEELRSSQRLLQTVFDVLPHILYVKDLEGRYLMVNQEMADFRGTTKEELQGRTAAELPGINPEEAKLLIDMDRQVLETGRMAESPIQQMRNAQGKVMQRRMIKLPIMGENGKITGTVGIAEDLTAQQKAEQDLRANRRLLQTMLDSLPHAILLQDLEGRFQMVNQAMAAFHGLTAEEMIGMNHQELSSSRKDQYENFEDILKLEQEVLKTGRTVETPRLLVRSGTGEETVRHSLKIPVHGDEGELTGILTISQDVTEKVKLEELLRHSQKIEAIGQLSGGVAHDFNNLLTIILGNLELLKHRLDPESELYRFASRSSDAAERGSTLTQRMLAFSRKQSLNPVVTDLNILVRGVTDLLQSSLGETIPVRLELEAGAVTTKVDRSQLENVLINLALNARDAMPDGGELTISTEQVEVAHNLAAAHNVAPGTFVSLTVTDMGQGMSPEVLDRSIDPFFTTKEIGQGSGLGLSTVYGFVTQSGGILQMESSPGVGTSVTILLPKIDRPAEVASPVSVEIWDGTQQAQIILIVEDNLDVLSMAREILTSLGYKTLEASDGKDALKILESNPETAVLFTDLVLPGGMNGRELATEARKIKPDLPILLTSGHAEEVLTKSGGLGNGMRLLPKPYRMSDLAGSIREILGE